MTLVGIAGFDRPETTARVASGGEFLPAPPRSGARGSAVRLPVGSTARVRITRPTPTDTTDGRWAHFGFWYRNASVGVANSIAYLINSDTINPSIQLATRTDGPLEVRRYSNVTVATTAEMVGDGNWHHIHVSVKITTLATGRLKVWVDGALSLDITAITSGSSSWRGFSGLQLLSSAATGSAEFDDAWLDDDNNEWSSAKVLSVATLVPDGPGASTAWTPTPAGQPNWQIAGDSTDDTYVSSQTVGARDLYTFADLPAGATTVEAVSLYTRGQQVGAGAPLVKPLHRHSDGTVTVGSGIAQGPSMGNNAPQTWLVNPATGLAWTVADVNAAQFGIELSN